jgi:hypothetical protein
MQKLESGDDCTTSTFSELTVGCDQIKGGSAISGSGVQSLDLSRV